MTNFKDVKAGAKFAFGGNLWVKQSTRTARIIEPAAYSGRWFYFGATDNVNTNKKQLN
jgi:hypothetical protein